MTLLGAVAAYFTKKAATAGTRRSLIVNLFGAGSLYLIAGILNIYILRFLPYSVVLPLTSLTYVWTLLIAGQFLKEQIVCRKVYGLCLICTGVILLGSGI